MKKVLAVAFVLAILSLGFSASAQVPYVQVFFDIGGSEDTADCPAVVTGPDLLYVFGMNFNNFLAAIEYRIDLPASLLFLGDIANPGALKIGLSSVDVNGISWSYPIPVNGFSPAELQRISVLWNCTDCTGFEDGLITVQPYPATGLITAVTWPDLSVINAIGMISTVCPVSVPTQSTTWGNVKALYN